MNSPAPRLPCSFRADSGIAPMLMRSAEIRTARTIDRCTITRSKVRHLGTHNFIEIELTVETHSAHQGSISSGSSGSHDPTSEECEAGTPGIGSAPVDPETAISSKEVKSISPVVLKTGLPNHLGAQLSPSPLRKRFLFPPNSLCRRVLQPPSPSREKEPDPCLPILVTALGAFAQGI